MTYEEVLKKVRELWGNDGRAKASGGGKRKRECRVGRFDRGERRILWKGHGETWERAFNSVVERERRAKREEELARLGACRSWAEKTLLRHEMGYTQLDEALEEARRKVDYDRDHPDLVCGSCGKAVPSLDLRSDKGLGLCCQGPGPEMKPPIRRIRRVGLL